MATVLSIVLGILPAVALRFAILRKPISRLASAGTCFGILIFVAMLVTTSTERKVRQSSDDPLMGPLPILTDLLSQMFYVGVPVALGSWFTLRRGAYSRNEGE